MAEFKLDNAGVRDILTSDWMRREVDAVADSIADDVRGSVKADVPVEVDHYTTDRDAAAVVIADMSGQAYQARDGVLTRAASGAGLEVKD